MWEGCASIASRDDATPFSSDCRGQAGRAWIHADRDRAVAEVFALLRPGGWLVVQEYSVAGDPAAAFVWDAVSRGVIIPLGSVLDGGPELYRYLRRSVHDFDSVDRFMQRLAAAGFVDIAHRTAAGWQRGILHTFVAHQPEEHA